MIVKRKKLKRKIKQKWNEGQQKAIDFNEGSVVVSACSGSGKTAVIIERINRLLKEKRVSPQNLLATTFTKKAAKEMDSRLSKLGIDTSRMSVQTFHSFCYQLLRNTPEFKEWIVDDKDKATYIVKHILGYKVMNWKGSDISLVMNFISSQRNQLISPDDSDHEDYRFVKAYFYYDEIIKEKKLLTFDDMLYFTVRLLQTNEKLRKKIQNKIQYLIVDEFQDVNKAQIELCDIIAYPEFNYMCVGDVDQSLYFFRGSIPEYMIDFQRKYNADLIELKYNYRCAPNIFNNAFTCVKNNNNRITTDAKPFKQKEKPIIYEFYTNVDDQACGISEHVKSLTSKKNIDYKDIYILLRTNGQTRPFEEVFSKDKIPFVVSSSYSFYDRREIKGLISYLRLAFDKSDCISGEFIVNKPFRFIAKKYVDQISNDCAEYGIDFLESCSKFVEQNGFLGTKLRQFIDIVDDIGNFTPYEAMNWVVEKTKYFDWLNKEYGTDDIDTSKIDGVTDLINSSIHYKTIKDFLEHVDEQIVNMKKNKAKKNTNAVQIMTYHVAKGAEAKIVFLPDANDGIIPHKNNENIEEERRIWYVGMTRAEEELYVSSTASNGPASRFLKESNIEKSKD